MYWLRQLFQRPSKSQREETISQEQIQIERQIFKERKNYIDGFIKQYTETERQKQKDYIEKENRIAEICNSRCPKCKSHDIIHKYKTYKGGTNTKINLCKSCGHEFKHSPKQDRFSNYYYGKFDIYNDSKQLLYEIVTAIRILRNFNPDDISEECTTIEEKKIRITEHIKKNSPYYERLINYPIEIIIYSAGDTVSTGFVFKSITDFVIDYGKYIDNYNVKNYMAKLTPQAHDLMVNYLGFKYHYNNNK